MFDRHLFIIGMPGSGKSSLGRRVAKEVGLPFADTDKLIEETSGLSVKDFFAQYGEEAFRQAETNVLLYLTRMPPTVVSTGGGTVLRPVNREIMRNAGTLLLIDRPLESILEDIRLDKRPLLEEKGLPEVERMYEERMPLYRSLADYTLHNDKSYFSGLNALIHLLRHWQ